MLTPQDVRSVQFEKNLRGYRTEDVDRFLDTIMDSDDPVSAFNTTVMVHKVLRNCDRYIHWCG